MKKITIFLFFLCSGCTMVGPNYIPPDPIIPEIWDCEECSKEEPPSAWWLALEDPLLNRYMEEAAHYNRDLLAAESAILQARAIRKITASQLFPQVNLDLSAIRTYFSKNGPVFALNGLTNDTPGLPFDLQIPQLQNIFTALLDVSWEIDLFGKIRRQIEGAVAQIGSMIAYRDGILLSIRSDIAKNYFTLRTRQQQGVLLEERICLLEKEQMIASAQVEKGLANRLSLEKIEAELERTKANLPPIYASIHQSIYSLSILTGRLPEMLIEELCPIQNLPCLPQDVACGLRSDLLRRRPDMRQAERELAASVAQIGVAVASFFPSFSLSLDIGLQSILLSNLFEGNSLTWSIGGSSVIPIFQGGNLVGQLRLSEAQAMQAAFVYQQTLLTSLKEAESALVAYQEQEQRVCFLREGLEKTEKYDALIEQRYLKGLVGLNDWLQSRAELNQRKEELLESESTLLQDVVTLYKALGSGWE